MRKSCGRRKPAEGNRHSDSLVKPGEHLECAGGVSPVTHQIRRHGKQANELDARVCHANVRVKGDSLGAGAAGAAGAAGLGALADRCPISFS